MGETTVWWHVQYKILTNMDNNESGKEELKAKLREELRRRPNPDEKLQLGSKNEQKIQTNDEWRGMNENSGKVMTQTKKRGT